MDLTRKVSTGVFSSSLANGTTNILGDEDRRLSISNGNLHDFADELRGGVCQRPDGNLLATLSHHAREIIRRNRQP